MPKASERTLQMRANYLKLHQEGLSPRQIAAHYNLAPTIVYNSLSRIAQEAGVSRESLLQHPNTQRTSSLHHTTQETSVSPEPLPQHPDTQNVNKLFTQCADAILTQLDQLQQLIAQDITDQTTLSDYFAKEAASWQPV